jgi:hypothetical protein
MTQPDLFSAPVLSDDQSAVYRCIESRKGKAQAVSAAEIVRHTGIADRRARALVKELVEDHGLPIVSCPSGFFVPATEEEIAAAYRQSVSWALSLLHRASCLKRSSDLQRIVGQLRLEVAA